LQALDQGTRGTANLVPLVLQAVEARATLGEISDILRAIFGEHRDRLA
jgi:methylmalonyl-CoA mutase N-terminal domain/subunit